MADLDHLWTPMDEGRRDGTFKDEDDLMVLCPRCHNSVAAWEDCPICEALGLEED